MQDQAIRHDAGTGARDGAKDSAKDAGRDRRFDSIRAESIKSGSARAENARPDAHRQDAGRAPFPLESAPGAASSGRELGDRILGRVARAVGSGKSARHLERDAIVTADARRIRVAVPSEFMAEYVGRNFVPELRRAASAEMTAAGDAASADDVSVEIVVEAGAFARDRAAAAPGPTEPVATGAGRGAGRRGGDVAAGIGPRPDGGGRRPGPQRELRHKLDDFVVGECNRIAYTAACAVAAGTAPGRFSPMFLHGPCGVGKTHLLQGLAVRAAERLGGRVKYTTAETFTNDFVQGVRTNSTEAFRRAFRDVEILCIDDIHFLAGKSATQAEFLHTFDALGLSGRMVVLASDEPPRDIRSLGEALISRFLSGAVIRIDSPDDATRVELVRRLSTTRGLALDEEAVALIAERAGRPLPGGTMPSVREIAGLLTRVEAMRNFMGPGDGAVTGLAVGAQAVTGTGGFGGGVIGRSMVAKALGLTLGEGRGPRRPVPSALIVERVCRSLRVDASDLMSRGRHSRVVLARALVTYLARRMTTMSYPEIARCMARPNHSTVITAYNRIKGQMASNQMVEGGPDLAEVSIQSLAERLEREIASAAG